jgi:signal peptidase II
LEIIYDKIGVVFCGSVTRIESEKVICLKRISRLTISILSIILLVGVDQITKKLAQTYLSGKEAIPVIGDFFILVYATNRGGFLSLGSGVNDWLWWTFFVVLPIVVLFLFSVYIVLNKRDDKFYLSFWVFVISGGIGNLIDRIFYGEVIDFLNIGIGSIRTGVFNVADIYLNVFAILVVLIYFIRTRNKESH